MDQSSSSTLRQYWVNLHNSADLENFYQDMETEGGDLYIPNRRVDIFSRLGDSSVTGYLLTDQEAELVRQDSRVSEVGLSDFEMGVEYHLNWVQSNNSWNKGPTLQANQGNWQLLRTVLDKNIPGWYGTSATTYKTSGTVIMPIEGSGVDIVMIDSTVQEDSHPELAWLSNNLPDGYTTSTRLVKYDWAQHADTVLGNKTSGIAINFKQAVILGQSQFYLNNTYYGTSQPNPTIYLIRGWTYTLNIDTLDELHITTDGNTSLYNDGLNNNAIYTGAITWTVAEDAPDNLYYNTIPASTASGLIRIINQYPYTQHVYRPDIPDAEHGLKGAAISAGLINGLARRSQIYSIEFLKSPMNVYGGNVANYFSLVREFHKAKPIDSATGYKRPTVVNGSFGGSYSINPSIITKVNYRGVGTTGTIGSFTINGKTSGPAWTALGFPRHPYFNTNDDGSKLIIQATPDIATVQLMKDLISDGVILCLAAGNEGTKIDIPGGQDYDNFIELYYGAQRIYYHRGSYAYDNLSLSVAAFTGYFSDELISAYSNRGPRVNVLAPVDYFTGPTLGSTGFNYAGSSYKYNNTTVGTSFAAPLVTGLVANVLEIVPFASQAYINNLLKTYSTTSATNVLRSAGLTVGYQLDGTPNQLLYLPPMTFEIRVDKFSLGENDSLNIEIRTTNVLDNSILWLDFIGTFDSSYIIGAGLTKIIIVNNRATLTLQTAQEFISPDASFNIVLYNNSARFYSDKTKRTELARTSPIFFRSSGVNYAVATWFDPLIYEYYLSYKNNDVVLELPSILNFLVDFYDEDYTASIEYDFDGNTVVEVLPEMTLSNTIQLRTNLYQDLVINEFTNTNVVKIRSTSPAGTTSTYTFYIEQFGVENLFLNNLQVDRGDINFEPNKVSYNLSVVNTITSATITATSVSTSSRIYINNTTGVYSTATATVTLFEGPNDIPIRVENFWNKKLGQSFSKGYTISILRNQSGFSDLTKLADILITLNSSPERFEDYTFDPLVLNYNISLPPETTGSSVTVFPLIDGQRIFFNGVEQTGSGSGESIQTYLPWNAQITKLRSDNPATTVTTTLSRLGSVQLSNINFVKTISTVTVEFVLGNSLHEDLSSVLQKLYDDRSSIPIDSLKLRYIQNSLVFQLNSLTPGTYPQWILGVKYDSGTYSAAGIITLRQLRPNRTFAPYVIDFGNTSTFTLSIGVRAENNSSQSTYTLNFSKQTSTYADLKLLEVSYGYLTPYFNSNTRSYSMDIPYEIESLAFRLWPNTPTYYIKYVNRERVLFDRWSPVTLNTGSNLVIIEVVAQDRRSIQEYRVSVNRSAIPNVVVPQLRTIVDVPDFEDPSILPPGQEGTAYSHTLTVDTGTITLLAGQLPPGLSISSTGVISGVIAQLHRNTDYKFVVRARNNPITDQPFSIFVTGDSLPQIVRAGNIRVGPSGERYIVNGMYVNYQIEAFQDALPEGRKLTYFIEQGDGELPKGLQLLSNGLITGQVKENLREFDFFGSEDQYDSLPIDSKPYDYSTVFGEFGQRYLNRFYSFLVTVSDGVFSAKENFSIQVYDPVYFYTNGGANTYPVPPQFMIDPYLGEFKSNNFVNINIPVHDPDPGSGTLQYEFAGFAGISELPPGLGLDVQSGMLFGWLSYTPTYKTRYSFIIRIYKTNTVVNQTSYRARTFTLDVLGTDQSDIEFISSSNLGILEQGQLSEIDIKLQKDKSDSIVSFSLDSGTLPPGLGLSIDGNIMGTVVYTEVIDDTEYEFTVKARDNNLDYSITKTFTLTVKGFKGIKYNNFLIEPYLSISERSLYKSFLENKDIFDSSYIYRLDDPAFGIPNTPRFVLSYGTSLPETTSTNFASFIGQVQNYFYRKRLYFGEYKKGIARSGGSVEYEFVYIDLVDEYQKPWGTIKDQLQNGSVTVYPNSIASIRNAVEKFSTVNYNFVPLYMKTIQDDTKQNLIGKLFHIICFCKPGYADIILERLNQMPMQLKELNFDFERLQYSQNLGQKSYKYLLFPIRKPLL